LCEVCAKYPKIFKRKQKHQATKKPTKAAAEWQRTIGDNNRNAAIAVEKARAEIQQYANPKLCPPARFIQEAFERGILQPHHLMYKYYESKLSIQVSASQCKSVQVSASQCKSVQVSASHSKSQQVNASQCKSMQVSASHSKSVQVTASHSKSQQVTASHSKSQQVSASADTF